MNNLHPASFADFDRRAREGEPLSVVFFGGSLTWGAYASDPQRTSYRALMGKYLRRKYPKTSFTFHDAAIGGIGSKLGLFRLNRDVLAHCPDLVFLDFAANDGLEGKDPRSLASYEGLLRELIGRGIPVMQAFFCFKHHLLPCDPGSLPGYRSRKELARAYRTGEGDALLYLRDKIAAGKTRPDLLWDTDPSHPDDPGYQMFFEAVRDGFEQAVEEKRVCLVPPAPSHPEAPRPFARQILAEQPLPPGWVPAKTYRTSLWFDGLSSRWMGDVALCDIQNRSKTQPLRIPFRGTFLGLIGEADENGLGFRMTIDGRTISPVNAEPGAVWDFTPPADCRDASFFGACFPKTFLPESTFSNWVLTFPKASPRANCESRAFALPDNLPPFPNLMSTPFFNAQHSPIGVFASFTLGAKGPKGGLGLELGKPADQNVYIGLEGEPGRFACLPFFDDGLDEVTRFNIEQSGGARGAVLESISDAALERDYTPGRDVWQAGDFEFVIHTPVASAPPPSSPATALRLAYVPALALELTVDNRRGTTARRALIGFQANDPWRGLRRLEGRGLSGLACGGVALVGEAGRVVVAQGFAPGPILDETNPANLAFDLGGVGLLIGVVPPGKKVTFRFTACFHRGGIVTTGLPASYFYTRFFPDIEAVARYALKHFTALKNRGASFDQRFAKAKMNPYRRFMLAHALHSYYGSTQLLDTAEGPLWIVNEGEYRMINTFDLTVDQLFFEEALNSWTVGNELDWFARRFSYTDRVRFPGEEKTHPGGISFTHDMGALNHFSAPGHSAYERAGLKGCFSQMTHEELVNWAVCALVHSRKNVQWAKKNLPLFHKVLASLLHRDHPDPKQRDGIMSLDSDRCAGGAEITTYDSLDVSLGQARNNLYLAVKCWGVYVGMEAFFARLGDSKASAVCARQAALAAASIAGSADAEGFLPAILHENVSSRIIPAVEGLVIPYALGLKEALSETGPYRELIAALRRHLVLALSPGVCLFPDGAWKISSTSENTWLSKVYLCQFVAEKILRCVSAADMERADACHAAWLLAPANAYWAWSDQIVSGLAKGSKYYPRGVTAFLWLDDN